MMKELLVKEYDVGIAGSFTMIILFTAVTLLLRSFYKRYMRMQKNAEVFQENEDDN
jgi:ABC-type multidrug transport system permease subunit